jgi:glycosyltransferase involved in cell wall biosynthesis
MMHRRRLQSRACIGAIMNLERPYIVEWVAWHRLLGFELVIADHGGDDGQPELLEALAERGFITRIDVRRFKNRPQRTVYGLLFRWARKQGFESIGYLDCDEFFEPMTLASRFEGSGPELIDRLFDDTGAAGLAFNWIWFGNSHLTSPASEPVTERFVMAAHENFNTGVKSFSHIERCHRVFSTRLGRECFIDVHLPALPVERLSHDGGPFRPAGALMAATRLASWRYARIRHYSLKTWEEYQRGKMRRGNAASNSIAMYDRQRFDEANRNEVYAPLPASVLCRLKEEMARIEKAITTFQTRPLPVAPWYAHEELRKRWLSRPYPLGYVGSVLARWKRAAAKRMSWLADKDASE